MTKADLAWVAGLLEGEGCFGTKGKAGTARNISVQCSMTDRDVLERLLRIVGAGALLGPYPNGRRKDGRPSKPRYIYAVSGSAAYDLMKKILPMMGIRRSNKIKTLLDRFESVPTRVFRIQHVASGRIVETRNLDQWMKSRGLLASNLWRTLAGHRPHHKGWRRLPEKP